MPEPSLNPAQERAIQELNDKYGVKSWCRIAFSLKFLVTLDDDDQFIVDVDGSYHQRGSRSSHLTNQPQQEGSEE